MKRILTIGLLALSLASLSACSAVTAWWQAFQADPVAYVTRFEQLAENALATATTVFAAAKPLIPADKLPAVEKTFADATFTARHALAALNDAVQAAVDAKANAPDFSKAINDVIAAVDNVAAIIDEFKSGSGKIGAPLTTLPASSFDEIKAQRTSLARYKK